ncbi:MAG: FG-GAP repeat protein, partial [Candidatus Eisenbacteria bacterium]|nr:FG-GAP repeat protein [Candidatus Eisenbacteria bacterium]
GTTIGGTGLFDAPEWTVEGDTANAFLGISVSTAGDVNGDGYDDVLVGATGYSFDETAEGAAFLYLGTAGGLGTSPDWTLLGGQAGARAGVVACAGDVNNDGYDDVIIGTPQYDTAGVDAGRVQVFHGSPSGLSSTPDWVVEASQTGEWFGWAVAGAGDLNGDGFDDIIVGSRFVDYPELNEGRALVWYGSASGITGGPTVLQADQAGAQMGFAVSSAGDVNGDGYDDVLVGAPYFDDTSADSGRTFCYYGGPSGVSTSWDWYLWVSDGGAHNGYSVAPAGDVNGDGYDDIIIGMPDFDRPTVDEGVALVVSGSSTGLPSQLASWLQQGYQEGAGFGRFVAGVGDVTGNGYDDIAVDAMSYDGTYVDGGKVFVYEGGPDGVSDTPFATAEGEQVDARFGASVGPSGDILGTGASGILLGSHGFSNPDYQEGKAYYFSSVDPDLSSSIMWNGLGDAVSWHDPDNWNLARTPVLGDTVLIPNVTETSEVIFGSGSTSIYSLYSFENLRLTGGTLEIDTDSSLSDSLVLETGAVLACAEALQVSGPMLWTGGTLQGAGTTTATGGLTIEGSGPKELRLEHTLENAGPATWDGSGPIRMEAGTRLSNEIGGSFDLVGSGDIEWVTGGVGGPPLLVNDGVLSKTSSTPITIEADVESYGTLEVLGGRLNVTGDLTNFSPGTQRLNFGTFVVADTLEFPGADIRRNAANVTLDGTTAAIVAPGDNPALTSFEENTGSFVANDVELVTPDFDNYGTISVGSGTTWTVDGATDLFRQFGGTTRIEGGGLLNAVTIDIDGGDLNGNGAAGGGFGSTLTNAGELRPGSSPGTLDILGIYIQNDESASYVCEVGGYGRGTGYDFVNVSEGAELGGRLDFRLIDPSGFIPAVGDTFTVLKAATITGAFDVVDSFGLQLRQETIGDSCNLIVEDVHLKRFVGGGSTSWFTPESWDPPGIPDQDSDILLSGLVTIDQAGAEADEIVVRAPNAGSAVLAITGGSLTARSLRTESGDLFLQGASAALRTETLEVLSGATFFWGSGTIELLGPSGHFLYANSPNSYLSVGSGSHLVGSGMVTAGTVENGGSIRPGDAGQPGTLTIDGDFVQNAMGSLEVEMGGTSPEQYDRVVVTGGASLGGSLVSSLVGGFVPQPTDQFQVMTFANRSGEFDLVEGATALYSATDVVLEQLESSDVGDPMAIPLVFALHPVRPNPSPVGTAIRYDLAQSTDVNLVVYDVSGRAVRTLLDGTNQAAGRYTADWDGLSDAGFAMPSGVYFYALETPQFSGTRRFVLLK